MSTVTADAEYFSNRNSKNNYIVSPEGRPVNRNLTVLVEEWEKKFSSRHLKYR